MANEDSMKELEELRAAIKEEEVRGAFEDPEQPIEFYAHLANPSDFAKEIAPEASRDLFLANLETRERKPTAREIIDDFDMAYYMELVGLDGNQWKKRGFIKAGASRGIGMGFLKQLNTKQVVVSGGEKKKRWSWK